MDERMVEVSVADLMEFLNGFRNTGNRYMAIDDVESFLMDYSVGPEPEADAGPADGPMEVQ